jgi:hypothetical protein
VDKQKSDTGRSSRWGALAGTYLVAALAGYALGTRGVSPFARSAAEASSATPLARVGFALREDALAASPGGWDALRNDVEIIRRAWKPEHRGAFDLVVALRGLKSGGNTEWPEAEQLCRELKWSRCDRGALEALKKRSRP